MFWQIKSPCLNFLQYHITSFEKIEKELNWHWITVYFQTWFGFVPWGKPLEPKLLFSCCKFDCLTPDQKTQYEREFIWHLTLGGSWVVPLGCHCTFHKFVEHNTRENNDTDRNLKQYQREHQRTLERGLIWHLTLGGSWVPLLLSSALFTSCS